MKSLITAFCSLFLIGAAGAQAADFSCVGTEPFWSLKVAGNTLTFSTPEDPDGTAMKIKSVRDAAGLAPGFARVYRVKRGCHSATLTIVHDEKCSDGMSDQTYTHAAVYDDGGKTVFYGCCSIPAGLY